MAMNANLLEETDTLPLKCAIQSLNIEILGHLGYLNGIPISLSIYKYSESFLDGCLCNPLVNDNL